MLNGVELARRSVELPPELFENHDACEAVRRAAAAERLWPMFAMGKGAAKALVSSIKLDGASMREEDAEGWRHVSAVIAHTTRRREAICALAQLRLGGRGARVSQSQVYG